MQGVYARGVVSSKQSVNDILCTDNSLYLGIHIHGNHDSDHDVSFILITHHVNKDKILYIPPANVASSAHSRERVHHYALRLANSPPKNSFVKLLSDA